MLRSLIFICHLFSGRETVFRSVLVISKWFYVFVGQECQFMFVGDVCGSLALQSGIFMFKRFSVRNMCSCVCSGQEYVFYEFGQE